MDQTPRPNDDDLVLVPVPRPYLTDVYRLIGQLSAQGMFNNDLPEDEEDGSASDGEASEWTLGDLDGLNNDPRVSFQRIATIMDVLAKVPGQHVSTTGLSQETGLSRREIRGALSGFSRALNNAYGYIAWPFTFKWGAPSAGTGQEGEAYYTMDAVTAKRWVTVRTSA